MQMQTACNPHGGTFETSPNMQNGEVSLVRPPLLNGEKRAFSETGTAHALNYRKLGVSADLAGKQGRGGARNFGDKVSYALDCSQIANLKAAERHARLIGLPFTRMLTIHWKAAGVPLEGIVAATGSFTSKLGQMLARHGSAAAYVWTHENGDQKGWHCHILAHVPAGQVERLAKRQRGWLRQITGRPYKRDVILSKPIGGRLGLEQSNPPLHAINLEVAFAYILKGASVEAAAQFNLERLEPGGLIVGKRCGTSQNIGEKARKIAHSARAQKGN